MTGDDAGWVPRALPLAHFEKRRRFGRTDAMMLPVVAIWGINLSLIKIALAEIPPLPFNGIRLVVASAVLLAFLWTTEGSLAVERRHLLKIVLLSISGYTVYQFLFIVGIHLTSAANTAILLGTSPIVMSLLSSFFKHETIRALGFVGIGLAFFGTYLVIAGRSGGFRWSAQGLTGDLVVAIAVLLWAHYSVSARPLLKVYSPLRFTTVTMSIGTLFFFPFTINEIVRLPFQSISFRAWACLVFSGVFALSVALIVWFISVREVGNSQTAVYSNLQPVLGVLFAHLLLREPIAPTLVAGCGVIFVGIYFTRRGRVP